MDEQVLLHEALRLLSEMPRLLSNPHLPGRRERLVGIANQQTTGMHPTVQVQRSQSLRWRPPLPWL